MRADVKELTDAMRRGWNKVPKMCYWFFNNYPKELKSTSEVFSACAMGHALLGMNSVNHLEMFKLFPILENQKVTNVYNKGDMHTLEDAINILVMKGWTTPQVIQWIESNA